MEVIGVHPANHAPPAKTYWTESGSASKSACCSGGTVVFALLLIAAAVPKAVSGPGDATDWGEGTGAPVRVDSG